jgi:hypothetical protein
MSLFLGSLNNSCVAVAARQLNLSPNFRTNMSRSRQRPSLEDDAAVRGLKLEQQHMLMEDTSVFRLQFAVSSLPAVGVPAFCKEPVPASAVLPNHV